MKDDTKTILAHKTWSETAKGRTRVVYYKTAVVTFDKTEIILNTGGWWTRSTKDRMNRASTNYELGFSISWKGDGDQRQWYVTYQDAKQVYNEDKLRLDRATGKMPVVR